MAKKPDAPCAVCGKLLWSGRTSLPPGQRTCRDCRRYVRSTPVDHHRCGRCQKVLPLADFSLSNQGRPGGYCRNCAADYQRTWWRERTGYHDVRLCDDCGVRTDRGRTAQGRFCPACSAARRQARDSRKNYTRRTALAFTDITATHVRLLRQRARRCPMCSVKLTDEPDRPNSKHLDHIIPVNVGGTHTVGNVRVICRTCNLTRPKNGSDLDGHQPTLWAQMPKPAGQLHGAL